LLACWFAWSQYSQENEDKHLKELKANNTIDAHQMSDEEFRIIFEKLWLEQVPSSHALLFHYCSKNDAKRARQSGLLARRTFNGVPFTLRSPHNVTRNDFDVFGVPSSSSSFNSGSSGDDIEQFSDLIFPNEEVIVVSLPRQFLEPLSGKGGVYETDHSLCMISIQLLSALKPMDTFTAVVDKKPWKDGYILLPPQCILRSYMLMNDNDINSDIGIKFGGKSSSNSRRGSNIIGWGNSAQTQNDLIQTDFIEDTPNPTKVSPIHIDSIATYLKAITIIRQKCFTLNLIPLYHYTSSSITPLIIKNGLRMSNLENGDGGVYFNSWSIILWFRG